VLGFSIVWVTLGVCQGNGASISPVHCLWFAALPIFDLLTCFVRRIRKGKSPFTPGRDHVHHILLRGGFRTRKKLAVLTAIQAIYAIIGLAGHFAGIPDYAMFAGWSVCGVLQGWVIGRLAARKRHRKLSQLSQTHARRA
jgi:UDP-GlcNAc:undecaprenyl-phosphate GlcNAc-1-phosphate transferase